MTTYQELKQKINDAAIILDREFPSWYTKINISKLDMSHSNKCIIGQLYGSYCDKTPLDNLFKLMDKNNPFGTEAPKEIWIAEIENRVKKSMIPIKAKTYAQIAELCKQVGNIDDQNKYNDLAIAELLAL